MTVERDTLERLRRSIDEAAMTDLAEIVREARLEARTKVRALLAEAIADKLLDLAALELADRGSHDPSRPARAGVTSGQGSDRGGEVQGPSASPHRNPPRDAGRERGAVAAPESQAATNFGCYVYGVVRADAELEPMTGLDGVHEVFLIRGESIAAVASTVSLDEFEGETLEERLSDVAWLESHARRHEHILDGVREQTALVPMRLCTIYHDERSVREMLAREHAFLEDALDRLEGRTEWGVKLYLVAELEEATQAGADAGDSDAAAGGSGASYLVQKQLRADRRGRSEAKLEECCGRAHAELAQAAVEAKMNPVQPRELTNRDEPMLFNGVYLVDDASADEFTGVVASLQSDLIRQGLELELTGPWPPYNFVNSSTEVGR